MKHRGKVFTIWASVFGLATVVGAIIPPGIDWTRYFAQTETFPAFYPPWIRVAIPLLTWPFLFSISVTGIAWGVRKRGGWWPHIIAAYLTFPFYMWRFLGSFDCIIMLGVLVLPWGIPLVIAKPQIAGFALLAKKEWLISAIVLTVILYLLSGWWPGQVFFASPNLVANVIPGGNPDRWLNYSLFPFSLLIAIPLLYLSKNDVDLLLAAGALVSTYVIMYHYVVLLPGLGRLSLRYLVICVLLSWLPFILRAVAPDLWAWALCNLFPLVLWAGIFVNKRKKDLLISAAPVAQT